MQTIEMSAMQACKIAISYVKILTNDYGMVYDKIKAGKPFLVLDGDELWICDQSNFIKPFAGIKGDFCGCTEPEIKEQFIARHNKYNTVFLNHQLEREETK